MEVGDRKLKKLVSGSPLSWKWGLVSVVQKMAANKTKELQFSTLDEFDALYSNQTLKFRKLLSLDCGDERVLDFKVFELTGDGILPTVYYADDKGRVVFIISGMEAYVIGG